MQTTNYNKTTEYKSGLYFLKLQFSVLKTISKELKQQTNFFPLQKSSRVVLTHTVAKPRKKTFRVITQNLLKFYSK